jgi:hypothetical protein
VMCAAAARPSPRVRRAHRCRACVCRDVLVMDMDIGLSSQLSRSASSLRRFLFFSEKSPQMSFILHLLHHSMQAPRIGCHAGTLKVSTSREKTHREV